MILVNSALILFMCKWPKQKINIRPKDYRTIVYDYININGNKICMIFWLYTVYQITNGGGYGKCKHVEDYYPVDDTWYNSGIPE